MTFTDGTNTLTTTLAEETSAPIFNSSTNVTSGGVIKQQADSNRLRINVRMYLTLAETQTLMSICANYTADKQYTPSKVLWGQSTATTLYVVVTEFPTEGDYYYADGVLQHEVTMRLEEVLQL